MRQIDLHWRFLVQGVLRDVIDNAYDGPPGLWVLFATGKFYPLANRVFVRPQLIRHRFVNQSNVHRVSGVPLRNRPTLSQRNLHRAQVTWGHDIEVHANLFSGRLGMIFNGQAAAIEIVAQRKYAGDSGSPHAREPRNHGAGWQRYESLGKIRAERKRAGRDRRVVAGLIDGPRLD